MNRCWWDVSAGDDGIDLAQVVGMKRTRRRPRSKKAFQRNSTNIYTSLKRTSQSYSANGRPPTLQHQSKRLELPPDLPPTNLWHCRSLQRQAPLHRRETPNSSMFPHLAGSRGPVTVMRPLHRSVNCVFKKPSLWDEGRLWWRLLE